MEDSQHWTEPGAYQVADGVHRIPLPLPQDGLRAVNVYVIETGNDLVLVDGGWALDASRRALEDALRSLGHRVRDISRFLVTHVHRDHYTQAVAIRREFGSKVSLGIGERPALESLHRAVRTGEHPQLKQLQRAGARPLVDGLRRITEHESPDLAVWEYPDEWLDDQTMLAVPGREIQAVPTPGHTQGHVVFADLPNGLLFAGDHVLPHITPSIGFELVPGALPLGDFLHSLARVRALPDLRLLPAHGPVSGSTHHRVDGLVTHHEHRLEQCRLAAESGLDTAYRVAQQLPWTRRERRFADLDVFNQFLAVIETVAHLDLLAARGMLGREVPPDADGGAVHYLTAGRDRPGS